MEGELNERDDVASSGGVQFSVERASPLLVAEADYPSREDESASRKRARPVMIREKWDGNYRGKKVLAPMVRAGTLPLRLLALDYGADIVYSEELVDKLVAESVRQVDDVTGTIDFVSSKTSRTVFSTCVLDHPNVLQLGSADGVNAWRAAEVVARDVDAIDLNMGCPKKFSIQGGMGAALLTNLEAVRDIITTLRRNLPDSMPVTCKVRLMESHEDTVNLLRAVESMGVSAIAVHARRKDERPREAAHWDMFTKLAKSNIVSVPLMLNGDIYTREDIKRAFDEAGADAVMIARGALEDVSIFGDTPTTTVDRVQAYMKKAVELDNFVLNSKYTVMRMFGDTSKAGMGRDILKARTSESLCAAVGLEDWFKENVKGDLQRGCLPSKKKAKKLRKEARLKQEANDEATKDVVV
eukprot:TRINITY_DN10648_c0_g1_i1.p1 TRINITY_DN10648_c0_g1~~TRINITY_DN10648_c0_g1_i1.p1  ORF type:complete len:412 (-),score=112.58 TRINITY_DN10648_c0_g1_i1:930-2165(-)